MNVIESPMREWVEGHGVFQWPEDVEVRFPDGESYDARGYWDANGELINTNDGYGAVGSPCHQALVQAGVILPPNVSLSGQPDSVSVMRAGMDFAATYHAVEEDGYDQDFPITGEQFAAYVAAGVKVVPA